MVPGFNTDFKYRGETYHVQTEDNGLANPVVVTLLYHKGAILASKRTPYREIAGQPGYEKELKSLMQSQHKDLMRSLLSGEFDKDGTAPSVAGGTGENPADAAAAVAGSVPAPAQAPPAAQTPPAGHKPLRVPVTVQAAATVLAPAAAPAQASTPAQPKPAAAPPPAPRHEIHTATAPASKPAQRPSGMSLDMAIRNYLEEFAAAAAAATH